MALQLPPLYVLRHGETEWNAAGRMQGWLDSPLTAEGAAQARHQGLILAQLGVAAEAEVRVSPLGRAMATAQLALPSRQDLRADDRLKEIDIGDWQGWTRPQMVAARPDLFRGADMMLGWYDHAPGGEGFSGLEARCRAFLNTLTGPTVVVTHGITSRMLRVIALGLDPSDLEAVAGGQGVVHVLEAGRSFVAE